ncbi:prepilin peptidase [Nocardia sp. ET3-3]|uniref:Prepilin peptidase n=1 Tax=Nocardia terrae TaxID=2675851 RepID=A0A7K1UU15_9NOCA|nr:A24 family peptidase [Nocardia terrae]MVU77856.1 prepilin peptidase [Nocardia terrae]
MDPMAVLLFTAWCLALSTCDLRARRLPNALTVPGALAALGYGFAVGKPTLALLGAVLLALPYLTVHLCAPHGLGAGDVKLALGLGAVTAVAGPRTWAWAALAAPMLTAAAAVGTYLARRSQPDDLGRYRYSLRRSPRIRDTRAESRIGTLAHGPAMCAASVVALLARR